MMYTHILIFIAVSLLITVYVKYPPAPFSKGLMLWSGKGKFMVIFGQRVFYVGCKNDSLQEVVLCLHGSLLSSYDWHKVWPGLLERFRRLIALDLLGHGLSDKPQKDSLYTVENQAQVVESLLNELKITKVHIMSHDFGSFIAMELLTRKKSNEEKYNISIESVCMLSANLFLEPSSFAFFQKIFLQTILGDFACSFLNFHLFKHLFLGYHKSNLLQEYMFDVWSLIVFRDGHLILPNLLRNVHDAHIEKERWLEILQQSSTSVKVIYGPADPLISPDFIPNLKTFVPNLDVSVLPSHVGQFPHLEVPHLVLDTYLEFVENVVIVNPFKI